jgi:hypothetical protein
MKILSKTESLDTSTQSNYLYWSGGAQMFVQAKKPGEFVELLVADNVAGAKKVVLHATKAPDYGTLRFTINGKAAGTFDGYAAAAQLSGPIELGVFEPVDGKLVLRAEVTGANNQASSDRYFFGLDCVVLGVP